MTLTASRPLTAVPHGGPPPTTAPGRRHRWWLAIAAVASPLLVAVNAAFHPDVDLTGAGLLDGAADGPTRWYAVHLVAAAGALLLVPAGLALRSLVPARGRALARGGLVAWLVAAVLLPISFAVEASVLRLATTADISDRAALAIADGYTSAPEFYAVGIGAAAATLGGLLFGGALWAAKTVRRRHAALYLAGTAATLIAVPGTVVGPLAFGAVAVAAALIAPTVARGPGIAAGERP